MRTLVFCDSVLGGVDLRAPAIGAALECCRLESELHVYAQTFRFLSQQFAVLDEALALHPELVIINHGGAECLTFPRPPGAGSVVATREQVRPYVASRRSVANWTRSCRPTAAARAFFRVNLRRPVRGPAMPWSSFEADYRAFVDILMERSHAFVILISSMGGDPHRFPFENSYLPRLRRLVEEIAHAHPKRIAHLHPEPALRKWRDYRPDRPHLAPSGHLVVSRMVAGAITSGYADRAGDRV